MLGVQVLRFANTAVASEISTGFRAFSTLHLLCLAACAAAVVLHVRLCRSAGPRARRNLRAAVGLGCLAAWTINAGFWLAPARFVWEQGLPLHYCNMANLLGTAAVLGRWRTAQALLFFWTFTLSIWAFVTPTVRHGPGHAEFWIFWIYHLFVALSVSHVLLVDGYRPERDDLRRAALGTLAYTVLLIVLDAVTGWNYGFVGPSTPNAPTPIDVLGPYPLRLVWIVFLGLGAFVLAYRLGRRPPESTSGRPGSCPGSGP